MRSHVEILKRKFESATRGIMVRGLPNLLRLVVVNEYPKSGGTWIGQMLSHTLELPFPRNRFPVFGPSIMHGHFLSPWGLRKPVVVFRDGRDIMVSWYYHCLFENDRGNAPLVAICRDELAFNDHIDIRENLPRFIEYAFTRQRHPRFSWADFARRWHGRKGVVYVFYEKMREDTTSELRRVVLELTGKTLSLKKANEITEKYSFARQSGRKPGEEIKGSFMRKGIVGDWRNCFSREACEVFDYYAGNELLILGYESDRTWMVNQNEKMEDDTGIR